MSHKAKQPGRLNWRPPASGRKPSRCLSSAEIARLSDDLSVYHRQYYSGLKRREQRESSMFYLRGQLSGLERKTIEPMALALHGPALNAIRAKQQFIAQSSWSAPDAGKQQQRMVAESLGEPSGVVIVDGGGFPSKRILVRRGLAVLRISRQVGELSGRCHGGLRDSARLYLSRRSDLCA